MISDFTPGDQVLAQWQGDRLWFPGQVHSIGEDGSVAIRYDDGTSEIRPANQVPACAGERVFQLQCDRP